MAAISTLMLNEDALRKDPMIEDDATPTTPRATRFVTGKLNETETTTAIKRPAPTSPPPEISMASRSDRAPAIDTRRGSLVDAMDVDENLDEKDESDDGTEQGDSLNPARKKKGQRFFCTGYPPCSLSFTRSEHLARHIRKHTGERPFQCHCNRRFSRLDNLRQHAQTVHVNEEIPTDSLAATGTRFQRQIRTDRVHPAGRPRTNTMSSTGSHGRGHSRNLSTSSIGSTSSSYSTSTLDPRQRPPPVIVSDDGRSQLNLHPPSTPPPYHSPYTRHSPGDVTTPTSTTFSTAPESPGVGSVVGSPTPSITRPGALFGGPRTPARRLSVPTGPNPFYSAHSSPYPSLYGSHFGPPSSGVSSNTSAAPSPTASSFSSAPTAEQNFSGDDWRRRTWHPSTYSTLHFNYNRPATSGLTYSQTPDAPHPAFASNATAAAGQAPRLPGIESFDHVQQRPKTPPRPGHSYSRSLSVLMPPADLETSRRDFAPVPPLRQSPFPDFDRPSNSDPVGSSWTRETLDQLRMAHGRDRQQAADTPRHIMGPPPSHQQSLAQEALKVQAATNRQGRASWQPGNISTSRTSPEDSGSSDGIPTPGTSMSDVQPAIMHSNGVIEPQHVAVGMDTNATTCLPSAPPFPAPYAAASRSDGTMQATNRPRPSSDLDRLDALVAVATSKSNAPS